MLCHVVALTVTPVVVAQEPTKPARPETLDPAVSCTAKCHQELTTGEAVHKPVKDGKCSECHKQEKPTEHTFLAIDDVTALCRTCHKIENAQVVHAPFESSDCTDCHDSHHSQTKALLRTPDEATLCYMCHEPIKTAVGRKFAHGPAADGFCSGCHKGHSSEHPKLLTGEPAELCTRCHSDIASAVENAATVHAPVSMDCGACHDAHGSDVEKVLKADQPALCYGCHKPLAESIAGSAHVHGALSNQKKCSNCHRAHESAHPKLLQAPGKDGCLSCHQKAVPRAAGGKPVAAVGAEIAKHKVLHGPVEDGNCVVCHNPHAAPHADLLGRAFPAKFYSPYSTANYDLCFTCHDKAAIEEKATTSATEFRDGDRNLHHLHVNLADKGRTCRACHTLHGGDAPKFVADKVEFGDWQLPIRWQQTPQGGSCAPGCHKQVAYSREPKPPTGNPPAPRAEAPPPANPTDPGTPAKK
jgi:predicted CXXCH cytochrome family protein